MVKKNKKKPSSYLLKMNFRTIFRSKLQFLAVILITALAMTLYVGLTSNAKSIDDRVNKLYQESNIADIYTNVSTYDELDLAEINKIVGDKGATEERFALASELQGYEATALMSDKLPTISKPSNTDNKEEENFFIIDRRLLESHNNPASTIRWYDENHEYLTIPVNFSFAQYLQIFAETKIGTFDNQETSLLDALNICLKEEKDNILEEPYLTLNLKITGVMDFSENVQNSQMNNTNFLLSKNYFKQEAIKLFSETFGAPKLDPTRPQLSMAMKTIFTLKTPEEIFTPYFDSLTKTNQYVTKINNQNEVSQVRENITNYFKNKENKNLIIALELDSVSNNMTIQNDIVQARQLAYIFPVIFFLVAILVVLTTISQLILKERIQIGTMKALGLSTKEVVIHYVSLALNIVLIGIVVGIVAGPFIIPMIMNQKYDILYSLPKMTYTLAVPEMLISTFLVLFLTALVTYFVVIKEARLNPSEGMRPKEIKSLKEAKSDYKITKNSLPLRMALRNIRLNFAKSLMVIFGICGCTALLVCGFGIDDTLNHGIEEDTKNFYDAHIYVTYNSNDSKKEILEQVNGVKTVEEYSCLPTTISNSDTTYQSLVYVFDDNSKFFNLDDYVLKDQIVVSNKIAKQMNLKIGDKIHFSSLGMTFEGEVGYILDCFYMHGIYVNQSAGDYNKLAKVRTNAWVDIEDSSLESQVLNDISNLNGVTNTKTRQENIDLINSYMSSISLMTLAVKIFAILLAIVVLYNLSLLNFKERMRDVATLKVLGFSKMEISSSLFFESLILTLIGVGFGLLLGKPMEILVLIVNLTPLVEFLYTVYPLSYVISLVLTIGTCMLVNAMLIQKIEKVQMVESLKSVE